MEPIAFLKAFMKNEKQGQTPIEADQSEVKVSSHPAIQKLIDFESTLERLQDIPKAFGRFIPEFEEILEDLADYRERCGQLEDNLNEERQRGSEMTARIETMKAETERLEYGLQREAAAHTAQRQKTIELEASVADLRLANADLNSRLSRLDPMVRELKITKETLVGELEKAQDLKERSEREVTEFKSEVVRLREQTAKLIESNNNLTADKLSLTERVDTAMKALAERDNMMNAAKDQIASLVAKLKRETMVSRSLKNENDQLIKEREDIRLQTESQLEAARGRYRVLERLLEESRMRYQAEAHTLNSVRREKSQREYELSQLNSNLNSSKEEVMDLRRQLLTNTEMVAALKEEMSSEAEKRRKLEIELDIAREENTRLDSALKSNTALMENNDLQHATKFAELVGVIEAVRAENDRLREEVEGYRFVDNKDEDEDGPSGTVISLTR